MTASGWRAEWFGNVRADILSGLVVALALIPEAISFSIIAGVDPKVGLYASFSMAVVIAIAGGRPAMIFSLYSGGVGGASRGRSSNERHSTITPCDVASFSKLEATR